MLYEKEICSYLNIPSIPKKVWDGKKPFKNACGIVETKSGLKAYAVFEFAESSNSAMVKKVFGEEPIVGIGEIYPIPDYMDIQNIVKWDLSEESKKAANALVEEAIELESDDSEKEEKIENEWFFDEIHNIDEARAWVASYRKTNKMKGAAIKDEDSLKNFLYVIYKNKKRGLK